MVDDAGHLRRVVPHEHAALAPILLARRAATTSLVTPGCVASSARAYSCVWNSP